MFPAGMMGIGISADGGSATLPHETIHIGETRDHSSELEHHGLALYAARSLSQQRQAHQLVGRRYAARGYRHEVPYVANGSNQITLNASAADGVVGTLTLRFDSGLGLCADETFGVEISALRQAGRRVCEFTKLAVDNELQSQHVLAGLFHMAYVKAHQIRRYEVGVIEVNPRHVGYYRCMLGFKVCSESRSNLRVQAPAVLMCIELAHIREQIDLYGGGSETAARSRSLYRHAFGPDKEHEMIGALRADLPPDLLHQRVLLS